MVVMMGGGLVLCDPVRTDPLALDPAGPNEEPQVRGAHAGSRRRLAQRQQVVRQGGLGAGLWLGGV
jgi:hypothetical protein